MSAMLLGDLHASSNPRDQYRIDFLRTFGKKLDTHDVRELYFLGDMTEAKDEHCASLVNMVCDLLYDWSQRCRVYWLLGNHDYINRDEPFFRFVSYMQNVKMIERPTIMESPILGKVTLLPHTRDYKNDWGGIEFTKLVLAHNTFAGSIAASGKKLTGIPTEIFKDHDVFAGDIHNPQKVGPVTYVGAPYTIDFGDDWDARVMLGDRKGWKEIPVTCPQKRLVDIADPIDLKTARVNRGDIVKVRMHRHEKGSGWAEKVAKVRAIGDKMGLWIYTVVPYQLSGKERRAAKGAPLSVRKTDDEIIDAFAARRNVPTPVLNTGKFLMDRK